MDYRLFVMSVVFPFRPNIYIYNLWAELSKYYTRKPPPPRTHGRPYARKCARVSLLKRKTKRIDVAMVFYAADGNQSTRQTKQSISFCVCIFLSLIGYLCNNIIENVVHSIFTSICVCLHDIMGLFILWCVAA